MNAKIMVLVGVMAACIFAQSDQKFKVYGFADMTLTKYFPKEESSIRGVSMMDERFMASFDHLNLYQEFRPNNRIRFLTEMSYQSKPPTYVDKTRNTMLFPDGMGGFTEMVTAEGGMADTNKYQKGIVNYSHVYRYYHTCVCHNPFCAWRTRGEDDCTIPNDGSLRHGYTRNILGESNPDVI